jgi:PHD/YefM family antitoxin component YafN of YafNO toxin-antitoxin module
MPDTPESETAAILADPDAMAALAEAEEDVAAGRVTELDEGPCHGCGRYE